MPTERVSGRVDISFWLQALVLLLAAPLLAFPSVFPTLTAVALLSIAIIWIANWILTKRPLAVTPLNGGLLALGLAVILGMIVTADPDLTLPKATGLLMGLALLLFLATSVKDGRQLRWASAAFLLLGAGIILLGSLSAQWRVKFPVMEALEPILPPRLIHLPESPDGGVHTNELAGVLAFYLPLAVAALIGWRPGRFRKPIMGAIVLVAGLAILLLFLTQSRSGWLGALVGVATVFALWAVVSPERRKRYAVWAGILLLIAAAMATMFMIVSDQLPGVLRQSTEPALPIEYTSTDFREEVWRWASTAVQDFPLSGTGLGTFRRVVFRLYPIAVPQSFDIAHAHNIFLQVALDVGLIGLMSYLAVLGITVVIGWRVVKDDRSLRPLAVGLLAGLLALHVYGLTDAIALGSKPGIIFWMALGLLVAMYRHTSAGAQFSLDGRT